jgi:hypothetical protein
MRQRAFSSMLLQSLGQGIRMGKDTSALDGLSTHERDIMSRLLRMAPEPQKDSPKSATAKGEAQRRRRENERRRLNAASNAG